MAAKVRAAVRTGPGTMEVRELPRPSIGDDDALMRVEVAGICGTDVKMYAKPPFPDPVIMGHENVGVLEEAGDAFLRRHGLSVGDRLFVEHYVGCTHCEWCQIGEYRHCELTDWRTNPESRRYGYTSADNPGTLWGGFAEYLYLPWNAVLHRVPDSVDAELAGLVTPLSNGIQWALETAGVGYGSRVLIQGPGQQGLSQVVACKQAGASLIVVSGTTRDRARLELARELGADAVVDVREDDLLSMVKDLTHGQGVDVVLDCTSGAGTAPVLVGIDALKRREGVMVVQGELAEFPAFPLKLLTEKAIALLSARGHSYRSCELALDQLASRRFPLERLATHRFTLDQADAAIRAVAGEGPEDVVHVSLLPWATEQDVTS